MRNLVSTYVDQFRQDRQKQIKLAAVLAALAVIVAGVVFWQLHSTGVAMTNEVFCGMKEHVHDESCYEQVLVCGLDESEPVEGHVHNDACYETVETLVCQDESEDHVHTEECYVTEQNLICGLEESEGTEGHVHSDACYETVLTCEIPEHTHTIDCMVDEEADVETAEDWEATLPEELSGVWAQDVVSIAESQIGYTESERNFQLADDGETRQGYTRYGAWYGNEYGDWDAMFASFCLNYAGVPEDEFPESSGVYAWTTELGNAGLYVPADKFTPQAGDLAFFDIDEDGVADSVGVISYLSSKDIYVIEGNYEDAVTEQTYDLDDNQIIGYGILPDQPGVEVEPVTLVQQTLEATIYSDASCVKTLSATESITLSGMMPENASVIAYPVDVTIGDMTILAAYDITIYDENGHEFEPEDGTIQVSISNSEIRSALGNNEKPVVYHINDHTDALEKVSDCDTSNDMIEFTAESFSIYIVGDEDLYQNVDYPYDSFYVYTIEFYRYEYDAENPSSELKSTQYVLLENYLNQPGAEEYNYHTFIGWYTETQGEDGTVNGNQLDFGNTLEENFDAWGWNKNEHTVKLYTAYESRYYVYYMLDENMWNEESSEEALWADFYTEEYRLGDELDTSSATSLVQVELGSKWAVTGWYTQEPTYDETTGEYQWNDQYLVGDHWVFGTDIKDDLKLYPKIEEVIWLYFTLGEDEGEDVEAAEPTYVLASETTLDGDKLPTEKTDESEDNENTVSRPGYTLLGWNAALTSDEEGNPLTWYVDGDGEKILITKDNASEIKIEDVINQTNDWIDLYAVWEPTYVGYTVNIWRQKATDGQPGLDQKVVQDGEEYSTYIKYYDYAESITVEATDSKLKTGDIILGENVNNTGNLGSNSTGSWSTWTGYGWSNSSDGQGNYEGFEYNETRTENNLTTITVKSDGSTIINIFYDRVTVTYHFGTSSSNPNSRGTLIGLYDTNTKVADDIEPGGTLNGWPEPGDRTEWHYVTGRSYGRDSYTGMSFLAKFALTENYSYRSNVVYFTSNSTSYSATLYYYLEVTNPDQVTDTSQTTVVNDTTYVLDYTLSFGKSSLSSTFNITDKYIGYTAVGYKTSANGNYYDLNTVGNEVTLNNNGTLYIFNDALKYNIELYSNHNGEQLIWSDTFKYGADLSEVELPTELDANLYGPAYYYHFTGTWWEDPTFTAEFDLPSTMPGNNLVAYADWELNDITVTFNSYVESDPALFDILEDIYGDGNVTINSDGQDGLWSYSITLKATDMLDYRLDDGLKAAKENDEDPDIYEFITWWNTESNKVFDFKTVLYDDITLEAKWHEEDTFYQVVYVINWEDYIITDDDPGYRLGTLHTREGEAEVRQVDYHFDGNEFNKSEYPGEKFICWAENENGTGTRYYPGLYVEWQNFSEDDTRLEKRTDENGSVHYYYVLYAVWAEENEAVLHLYPNWSGTGESPYYDVSTTVENLGQVDLSKGYIVVDGTQYAIPDAGDSYTDSNGVKYHFAGWSTTDPDGPGTLDDVDVPCGVTVGVDGMDYVDDEGNVTQINNLYGVWLADKDFTIEKVDTSGYAVYDAEFTLSYTYTTTTETEVDGEPVTIKETYTYYYDGENDVWIEWTDDLEGTSLPTITIGNIEFEDDYTDGIGLFDYDGTFTLSEINEPDGYEKLESEITFKLDTDDDGSVIVVITGGEYDSKGILQAKVSEDSSTTLMVIDQKDNFPVRILKYTGDYESSEYTVLEGAEFILSKTVTITDDSGDSFDTTMYAVFDDDSDGYMLINWTEEETDATTIQSDSDGKIYIDNLEVGTYTLTEIKAPDGYMLLDHGIEFTLDDEGNVTVSDNNAVVDANDLSLLVISNDAGSQLPHTGGIGTWIYTIAGVLLIGGAATLLVYRKRRAV